MVVVVVVCAVRVWWWWCVNGACSGSSGSRIAWGVDGCVVRVVVVVMVIVLRSQVCVM